MTAVWKFPVALDDYFVLDMPEGAFPLCVQIQNGRPWMWVRCNPAAPTTPRRFRLAGTGHLLDDAIGRYIDTVQMGTLVWHVFEAGADAAEAEEGDDHGT